MKNKNKKHPPFIILEFGATIFISMLLLIGFFIQIFYGIVSTISIVFDWIKKNLNNIMCGLSDLIWKIKTKMWEIDNNKS